MGSCSKLDKDNTAVEQKQQNPQLVSADPDETKENPVREVSTFQTSTHRWGSVVMLATARAIVLDNDGNGRGIKLLLDTASQGTFITESCVRRLRLNSNKIRTPIFGFGNNNSVVSSGIVNLKMKPSSKKAR